MKNKILLGAILIIVGMCTMNSYAQSWNYGLHKIYSNPDSTTRVGIGIVFPSERLHINKGALKIGNSANAADRSINLLKFGNGNYVQIGEWEADNTLSFKASKYDFTNGNVGIGIANPQCKLDVNGKLLLRAIDNRYGCSYLNWESHKLIMGTPEGTYGYNYLELKPGGCDVDSLFSQLTMYTAYSQSNHVAKIKLNTSENCWINTYFNVGIGTDNPLYKLDVRGTIRANEILVNTVSGADFVFDKSYKLRPLNEVKDYIQEHQHLPEIQSAKEMEENGVNMNKLQIQLLQKIEELTLYIIQQEQRIQELESKISK